MPELEENSLIISRKAFSLIEASCSEAIFGCEHMFFLLNGRLVNTLQSLEIWSISVCPTGCTSSDIEKTAERVTQFLPGGLNVIGILKVSFIDDQNVDDLIPSNFLTLEFLNICGVSRLITAGSLWSNKKLCQLTCQLYDVESETFYPISHDIVDFDYGANNITILLQGSVDYFLVYDCAQERYLLDLSLASIQSQLAIEKLVLKPSEAMHLLPLFKSNANETLETLMNNTVAEYFCLLQAGGEGKKQKTFNYFNDYITFEPLSRATGDDLCSAFLNSVPHVSIERGSLGYRVSPYKLVLNVVCICDRHQNMQTVCKKMFEAIQRQMRQFEYYLNEFDSAGNKLFVNPTLFILLPDYLGHFLCVIYPTSVLKDLSVTDAQRDYIHRLFALPLDRPLIRPANRFQFPDNSHSLLLNPHKNLAPSGVNGRVTMIQGNYYYKHYMQDSFNDKGWGCAYRSFQTIWTWFMLQGFTTQPVPTHKQIQQALVKIGDKPSSFIGSNKWVGSIELSYCLSEMLDLESRIITASCGSELASKARELEMHFLDEGTPVMIGGGVLAHTIIAVDFNENTGDVRYLVVDPHYTGDEDLKTVCDKGWVGWKPVTFWEENAFYNLLLPKRPRCI